ncbi:putative oleosin [Helianthus annuus]|uniref:Oleosin n=1 Tax=Helianthus annuus TaxID=4232 RepID=A0A251S7K5_HELAN|nr:oleosin [Helianthus annuus]KAF5763884.1 putative oleosin [Helianthus annuus]KAJ0450647.1 Oleosin [Helianthus annuus]KAJ0454877.1 Oleosin [Helianthus annuus]KAJ0472494.1 Oleosin [Helianthus annuus]KAJ0648095.1 Oleosin [Helianthus annuus]
MATTTTYDRHFTTTQPHYRQDDRSRYDQQTHSQSTSRTLAIIALLPVGGILLGLAGLTFIGTLIGLALATPLFVIFSPIIVPAVLTIGLAVTGFLASGTFGLTGLSSLSYLFNMVRQTAGSVPESLDYVKGTLQDAGEYAGQKTKDFGQKIQNTAHEMGDQGQGGQVGVHAQVGGGKEGRKSGDRT